MTANENKSTFADEISRLTGAIGYVAWVERTAESVTISWPIRRVEGGLRLTAKRLAEITGVDEELFCERPLRNRIYLDMPIEIADELMT